MERIEVQRLVPGPIGQVWDRYTDHVSWARWAGLARAPVRLEREGTPTPNGVGCVRVFSAAGLDLVAEEVLSFEPPGDGPAARMTYRVVRGGWPLRDHLGEVDFAPREGGTLVTWRCRFRSAAPGLGPLVRRFLAAVFRSVLSGLTREIGRGGHR